jgi:integrase
LDPGRAWRARCGGAAPEALIFTTPSGKPVRHNLFYRRVFQPAAREALPGLADYEHKRRLTFHDMRHTAASHMLAVSGGNFYLVKERLGHEDIQTTVNTTGNWCRTPTRRSQRA